MLFISEGEKLIVEAGMGKGEGANVVLRTAIAFILVINGIAANSKGGKLQLYLEPMEPLASTACKFSIVHYSMASDGYDPGMDAPFLEAPFPPSLDMYEMTSFPYPNDRLSRDARGSESMSPITSEIDGRGLSSPLESQIEASISEVGVEHNMLNKKIIGRLYEIIDGNDVLVGTYDCWNMTESGQKAYLTVKNGSSHRWVTNFYNTNVSNFNNDDIVNFLDYAILANHYGKGEGNYLADISGPSGISDGVVDEHDLREFTDNWLAEE